jgi:nucleoside-diphosphate-sugar epimerase
VQNRSPNIDGTRADLGWAPSVGLRDALTRILESYRQHVADARRLVE